VKMMMEITMKMTPKQVEIKSELVLFNERIFSLLIDGVWPRDL